MKKAAPEAITIDQLRTLDLDALRGEIAAKDAEIAKHEKERDGMIALLKAVDVLQNGKPPRKLRGPRKPKGPKPFSDIDQVPADKIHSERIGGMPEVIPNAPRKGPKPDREKIADLLRSQGGMQAHQIAGRLALSESRVNTILNSDAQFEMHPGSGRWSVSG